MYKVVDSTRDKKSIERVTRAAGTALFVLFAITASGCHSGEGTSRPVAGGFVNDAGGAPAVEERRLVLTAGTAGRFGLLHGIAFCDDVAYLHDNWRIYEVRLTDGQVVRTIGESHGRIGPGVAAAGVVVDCDAGFLYRVEMPQGVGVYQLTDGAPVRWIRRPEAFAFTTARGARLAGGQIFIPGLWQSARGQYQKNGRARFYDGSKLGWSVDVSTGESAPILELLDQSCAAMAPYAHCLALPMDYWGDDDPYWVFAQGSGESFGIADAQRSRVIRVSARSPKFARRADSPAVDAPSLEETVRWGAANSAIQGVFATGDIIAVEHVLYANPNWTQADVAQPMQFIVHVNLYDRRGEGLVSDIALKDTIIGRDDRNIYFIDYGPEGRRTDAEQVTLVSVSLKSSLDYFGVRQ